MEKKSYIKPEMQVTELEMESTLMAVSAGGTLPGTGNGGDSEGGMEAQTNDRRGSWGNLWN